MTVGRAKKSSPKRPPPCCRIATAINFGTHREPAAAECRPAEGNRPATETVWLSFTLSHSKKRSTSVPAWTFVLGDMGRAFTPVSALAGNRPGIFAGFMEGYNRSLS